MTKYFAKENIDKYKKGDSIPEAQAKIWMEMFKISPIEVIEELEQTIIVPQPKSIPIIAVQKTKSPHYKHTKK